MALERADIDREARIVRVCKRYTGGALKRGTKRMPERYVPLGARVLEAPDAMTPRIDTPILFPAARGGHMEINKWRLREWYPALRAAGLEQRGTYTMRHTFATWAIEKGTIPLPQVAAITGTSIRGLEDTYHRWLRLTDRGFSRRSTPTTQPPAESRDARGRWQPRLGSHPPLPWPRLKRTSNPVDRRQ